MKKLTAPIIQALLAAFLFGASAPLAKLLLADIQPVTLAGLLYLGSGIGALLFRSIRNLLTKSTQVTRGEEAPLKRNDLPWLVGAILAGGILGPIFSMLGLKTTPAATASLLLNFESVATVLIAVLIFKESNSKRIYWAVGLITLASSILSWNLYGQWGLSTGSLLIIAACLMWGIDNNLTRNISAKDPLSIVLIKGLSAGTFSLCLSFLLGYPLPELGKLLLAILLGSLSYGLSISLFVLALRGLGAARTGALFASAPFVGAILSFAILRENLTVQFALSLPVMLSGAALLVFENHDHEHVHPGVGHEHSHCHDDLHHTHEHEPSTAITDPACEHSHFHEHESISHCHPHKPDIHHWHVHESAGD